MRYSFFLFVITIAAPIYASTNLYNALKSLPQPQPLYSSQPIYTTALQARDNRLLKELDDYWMRTMIHREFRLFNPEQYKDYVVEDINVNKSMSGEARALTEDTLYTQVALITAVGVLVVLPESISKWDLDELQKKSLGERWIEHTSTKPVWDEDEWAINYIGHPVFGAVYYTMARNDGMDIFESALFSTVMSTFFWEYGYESFAEIPSIQDLIFTPLLGAFLGEGMHYLEGELDDNEGKIWGFQGLGSFSYFVLDPMGNIAQGLSETLNIYVTMEFATFERYNDLSQFRYSNDQAAPVRFQDRDYGFMLTFH